MQSFSLLIQEWYRQAKRNLPWRETDDPYKIWISEVILQQTRVDQGLAYYKRFIERFPTVKDLAEAEEQEVLTYWQGLGYYSRARNLHFAAKQIVNDFNAVFPSTYKDILKLKGVGEYTAAAIASIAFQEPHPVIDGNVYRVLSRFFNDPTPIDTSEGKRAFKIYAEEVFNPQNPAEFNQAIMELGALVCKPKKALCEECPLQENCAAYREGTLYELPKKEKKIKITHRYFNYLVNTNSKVQIVQRKEDDIWKNMFQFPLIETSKNYSKKEISEVLNKQNQTVKKLLSKEKRILSHQHLIINFWEIDQYHPTPESHFIPLSEIEQYPLPKAIENFIKDHSQLFL